MNDGSHALTTVHLREKTYRMDMIRGGLRGILTTGTQTFALFIAIRYYNAGDDVKSLIGAAPFIGMFLSMYALHYLSHTGWSKSLCGAIPTLLCGLSLLIAAATSSMYPFAIFTTLGFMFLHLQTPFLTSIYHDNYPSDKRGSYYSLPVILTVSVSVLFGIFGSRLLDHDLNLFPWVIAVLGVAGVFKSWAIFSMPSKPIEPPNWIHPLGNFKYIFEDRLFGYVLLTWFIMGFANLWVLPLRVDYLTNPEYGIEESAFMVTLLITIIPDAMRAVSIPVLARMFDRMNFIVLRMILNLTFGTGIALFFFTTDPTIIATGSALIGIAFGGGSIAWALWVTKFAPPDKVAAYMSVHVSLTGIRGTLGPMIGFWAVRYLGPVNIGFVSFALMLIATLMLIPEIRHGRGKQTA